MPIILKVIHSRDQPRNVLLPLAVRVSDSCRPSTEVTIWFEGRVNRVEVVTKNGILDGNFLAVIINNSNFFILNNLVRRDELEAPVPVGLAQVLSSFGPCFLVDLELLGLLNRGSLKDLLQKHQDLQL